MMKKTILHITADFPDPLGPVKTRAVEWLVGATDGFRHVVYSLNRVNWTGDLAMLPFGEDRTAIAYAAPPYGIRMLAHLTPVAEAIAKDLAARQIVPDVIHAHKFTIEGIIADQLSTKTGAPFIANLWGDTDTKLFERKPSMRSHYRAIGSRAAMLLPPAPWTADYFGSALQLEESRFEVLSVMTAADDLIAPRICNERRVITVFGWDAWRRKGLDVLLQAVALLAPDMPDFRLDVFGRGRPKALMEMTKAIQRLGIENHVTLCPPLNHQAVQQTMNSYAVFAMPSRYETFGMVYVEALLAGVPILWSRDRGIDGLFDGVTVGRACDSTSAADVAEQLRLLLAQEERYKTEIGRLQQEGALDYLRRAAIAARYKELLARVLAPAHRVASAA